MFLMAPKQKQKNCHDQQLSQIHLSFFLFCPDESNSIPVFWPLFSANGMVCPVCYSCTFSLVLGEWGVRGRCPFKWSTWRLWPVINEFAVTHGSCKETSGSKGERESTKERGGGIQAVLKHFIYAQVKNDCAEHAITSMEKKNDEEFMLHDSYPTTMIKTAA